MSRVRWNAANDRKLLLRLMGDVPLYVPVTYLATQFRGATEETIELRIRELLEERQAIFNSPTNSATIRPTPPHTAPLITDNHSHELLEPPDVRERSISAIAAASLEELEHTKAMRRWRGHLGIWSVVANRYIELSSAPDGRWRKRTRETIRKRMGWIKPNKEFGRKVSCGRITKTILKRRDHGGWKKTWPRVDDSKDEEISEEEDDNEDEDEDQDRAEEDEDFEKDYEFEEEEDDDENE